MRWAALSVVGLLGLGLGACRIDEGALVLHRPGEARTAAAAERRMHERFEAASNIQRAIAFGDLERARAEAQDIAAMDDSRVSLTWQPYFEAVRDAAHQVELSTSLVEAARAAAWLGQRCADCHVAIGARVEFPAEPPPAGGATLAVQMPGHQWAAAQMWRGLIGPSDERWVAGARALAAPRPASDLDDFVRIRRYAGLAVTARLEGVRAELFGTLLTSCAHCHAARRDQRLDQRLDQRPDQRP